MLLRTIYERIQILKEIGQSAMRAQVAKLPDASSHHSLLARKLPNKLAHIFSWWNTKDVSP
jgi:hypothetical protein